MNETLLAYFILGLAGIFVPPIFFCSPGMGVGYRRCLSGWVVFILFAAAISTVVWSVAWALSVVLP